MPGPMDGIKVVEMGFWVAGPSCAAILADWGASVIKIEPPTGDPFRGLFGRIGANIGNPAFELDNRGKRSISLNLETEEARRIAGRLIDDADVFVSNVRPGSLERLGLDYDSVCKTNPRIIYAQVTGYGPDTPDRDRAAYDVGAFWARAGVAASLTSAGNPLPQQRGGMGDHMTGANAAGAIAAALFHRERTGKGQRVAVSLMRIGAYMMGWDLNTVLRFGTMAPPYDRRHSPNPIINSFQDRDGRWFWLLLLQGDRHWPDLLRALDAPQLGEDPRFKTLADRLQNTTACVEELDAIIRTKTLAEWAPIFDANQVWFAPVQTLPEVAADPVAQAAGCFVEVDAPEGPVRQVATPATFYGTPVENRRWAPELGQDTESVLLELGFDWDGIIALKEAGAIP